MYAVIKTGGKQYRVAQGDRLRVEKLVGEVGTTVTLDEVLMIGGEKVVVGETVRDVEAAADKEQQLEPARHQSTLEKGKTTRLQPM